MRYVIYNPLACNGKGEEIKDRFLNEIDDKNNISLINGLEVKPIEFKKILKDEDEIILIGGDGTVNVFVNEYLKYDIPNKIYLYGGGSGNDFLNDIDTKPFNLVEITKYLANLPYVNVNDKKMYFINNVGYGIDGRVCYEAERLKREGKKFNYTAIAAKLLLKYKKKNVKLIIDGKTYEYKNVILAATMNGKYYGGGMKNAPDQNRLSDELTVIVLHMKSNIHAMIRFPKMIKGLHYKYKKIVAVHKGKDIEVIYDAPEYIQVDGEVLGLFNSYKVKK